MRPFEYQAPASVAAAVGLGGEGSRFIAGGTELIPWMKDGIEAPSTLIDLSGLGLTGVRRDREAIRIGATTTLAAIAGDPLVVAEAPGLAGAIDASASPQIRAMGTIGGNLLQRTRCPYFRMPAPLGVGCHLRHQGSGCAARTGDHRAGAVLGDTSVCLATHPSDAAVVLAALDARLALAGPAGARSVPLSDLYRDPAHPALGPGELIVEIIVPIGDPSRSSRFLKVRDRASFDFALVSGAAAEDERGPRLALGGLAWGPWRCAVAEGLLSAGPRAGAAVRTAMAAEFGAARPLTGNRFKLELAVRLALRLLASDGPPS